MKLTSLILLLSVFCFPLNAQYVDEDGRVDKDRIIAELKQLENWSEEQENLRSEIFDQLVEARQDHPEIILSKDKRTKITLTIIELGNMQDDFYFLNPNRKNSPYRILTSEERRRIDTVSHDLQLLEQELKRFQDSIGMVYDSFKRIIESRNETRASKEKAVYLLATSNDLEDIDYLFANNKALRFGTISEQGMQHWNASTDEELWLSGRTAMVALNHTKFVEGEGKDPGFTFWILLPFFMKYWGDPEWVVYNNYIELIILLGIMREYKEPWHLMNFIKANVQNTNTPIMKMIKENGFAEKKE